MRININSHHIDISDKIKTYILNKFKKLKKHFNQITLIEITIISEKNHIKAEAAVYLSGTDLFADAKKNDIYCAIDDLLGKLDRQIIKHKEKLQGKNHRESLKKID
jgi:putative sigma-54 modulation protein